MKDPPRPPTLDERLSAGLDRLSPAERRVAQYLQTNRAEILVASAAELAARIGTSDATVVRATKALGYPGMGALRRELAGDLGAGLSPAARLVRTLDAVGDDVGAALELTLDIHQRSLEGLRRDVTPALFRAAVTRIVNARRVFVFGIGPSSAMADYLAIQLGRFGIDAAGLTQTGLLLADGLHRLREGDLVMMFAYGRVYREIEALLDHARRLGLGTVLVTDTLRAALAGRVDVILPVARGRADMLSMHAATLGLIEALLVGVATKRRAETVAHLELLNALRAKLVGRPMDLPAGAGAGPAARPRRGRRRA
jgi:DNA-binding MurR/RpiR family transcriptional regulator